MNVIKSLSLPLAAIAALRLSGCSPPHPVPPAAQDVIVQCAVWRKASSSGFDGSRGCVYVEQRQTGDPTYIRLVLHLGDKIAGGEPFCVRATYPTGYVQLYCTNRLGNWATANNQYPKLALA